MLKILNNRRLIENKCKPYVKQKSQSKLYTNYACGVFAWTLVIIKLYRMVSSKVMLLACAS